MNKSTLKALLNPVQKGLVLPPLPSIRDLLKMYKLRALKQMSQNFLMDTRVCDRIVRASGAIENNYVCEVGPGPGNITRSILLRNPKKVIVIEKDQRFIPMLELLKEAVGDRLEYRIADIMNFNMETLFPEDLKMDWHDKVPDIHVIGNLPFNVSTNLIIRWLRAMSEQRNAWSYGRVRLTLTFQKEVAERMVAPILAKHRCRLSVICQAYANVNHKFNITNKCFLPCPEVDVGVVKFIPLKTPIPEVPFEVFEKVVRTIFNLKRSKVHLPASKLFPLPIREKLCTELFDRTSVDPTIVARKVSVDEFASLAKVYHDLCQEHPCIVGYDYRMEKRKLLAFEKEVADKYGVNMEDLIKDAECDADGENVDSDDEFENQFRYEFDKKAR